MSTNNGGPAFPFPASLYPDGSTHDPGDPGMSLRDYFAAKAMQGLMGRNWSECKVTDEELIAIWARSSYGMADAMMKERSKT